MDAISIFNERERVWVSENFQRIFLDEYLPGEYVSAVPNHLDLQEIASGTNVDSFVFTDSNSFLVQLASLLQKQPAGIGGALLNDSSANYFFVRNAKGDLYSVLVRWEPAQKLWRCGAYLQEELKMPSVRIFRPSI